MYIPVMKRYKVERDCPDFRGFDNTPHCCMFSESCDIIKQKMFIDDYYDYKAAGWGFCLGVSDDAKLSLLGKICTGKPIRLKSSGDLSED